MKQLVTIKSNKYGIEVYLDSEVSFEILLDAVRQKFMEASRFFRGAQMVTALRGRELSKDEEQQIVETITKTAQIEIICLVDYDEKQELIYKNIMEESLAVKEKQDGKFYKGTLKKRQVLESERDIIILGDVELGARVVAKGSIIVIGTVMGSVHAGVSGSTDAFIVALSLRPKKLKIADVEAKAQIVHQENATIPGPKIAVLDGRHIYIDPLSE